jgi:hypothetical protein
VISAAGRIAAVPGLLSLVLGVPAEPHLLPPPSAAQESQAGDLERWPLELIGGALEAEASEDGDVRVELSYGFGEAREEPSREVSLLVVGGSRRVVDLEVLEAQDWVAVSLDEVAAGRWEGRVPLQGNTLRLRYRVPVGFARDGREAALDLPVPAVVGAGGDASPDLFRIRLSLGAPVEIRAPFPSNLRLEGEGMVVGSAPVVPGVVRFGSGDLLGPPRAPGSWPGATFWGLWLALAALLGSYAAWMVRTEARDPDRRGPAPSHGEAP